MNRSILCDLPPFTTSLASHCERLLGAVEEQKRWSPSVKVLVPAVTYRRTSVPEAKKEEQAIRLLSSPGPVVPQLLLWLLPAGIPHSERLLGRPLGPKLYAIAMVPLDSLLQRRYRTLQAEHLFLVYRSTPRRGMCTSSNNKNGTIGSYVESISGYRYNHLNQLPVSGMLQLEKSLDDGNGRLPVSQMLCELYSTLRHFVALKSPS